MRDKTRVGCFVVALVAAPPLGALAADVPDLPLPVVGVGGVDSFGTVIADMDGDGRPDLVTTSVGAAPGARVWLGDGAGELAPLGSATFGSGPTTGPVVFDADQDGDLDVGVVVVAQSAFRRVLNDGHGVLGAWASVPVVASPRDPRAADMDLDGDADVVVASSLGFTILASDGAGGFAVGNEFVAPSGAPSRFTIGDVDGDGDADVVSVRSKLLDVLAGDGLGGLAPASSVAIQSTSPADVTLGDLDGDADLDLVVANTQPSGQAVERLMNGGGGVFGASQFLGNLDLGRAVRVADLDGDGVPEVVALHQNGFLLSALGSPGAGAPQAVATRPTSGYGWSLSLGNLDADGVPDAVVACASGPSGRLVVVRGHAATLLEGRPITNVGASIDLLALADMDGDGDRDAVAVAGVVGEARLYGNDGAGGFSLASALPLPHPVGAALAADLNGDGFLDVVACTPTLGPGAVPPMVTLVHGVPGGFVAHGSFALPAPVRALTVGRFNADPVLDVAMLFQPASVSQVELLLSVGGGYVASAAQSITAQSPTLAAIDADQDGLDDLAVGVSPGAWIHRNQGGVFSLYTTIPLPDTARELARLDVDGDGLDDLAALSPGGGGSALVLRGAGSGTFHVGAPASTAAAIFGEGLRTDDVDGDGRDDVTLHSGGQHGVAAWLGSDGAGGLLGARASAVAYDVSGQVYGDVDGDGRADLVTSRSFGGVAPGDGGLYVALAGCLGRASTYGYGCSPSGPAPRLTIEGCLEVGQGVTLRVKDGPAAATGLLVLGLTPGATPLGGGCSLLVASVLPAVTPFAVGPGGAGAVSPLLGPAAAGQGFTAQVVFPGGPLAATNGLELQID